MRKLIPYFFIFGVLSSCIDNVDHVEDKYPQQWQLVRISGEDGQSSKHGGRLEWQEFYLLNPDGTFLKSRLDNGTKISATGVFSVQETPDETTLVLTYDAPSEIIGTCTSDLQETLVFLSNNFLIGTWAACDGPGLEYFRVK